MSLEKEPEKKRESYYQRNKERLQLYAKARYQEHKNDPNNIKKNENLKPKRKQKSKQDLRKISNENLRKLNVKKRTEIFSRLVNGGEIKCAKCGFNNIDALQIDHKNGGGSEERRRLKNSFYDYVLSLSTERLQYRFQVLCANCNIIKERERKRKLL